MKLSPALILALTAAMVPIPAQAQEKTPEPAAVEAISAEKQAFLEACAARKFETIVEVVEDGAIRGKKVTLCGKVGQSDAEWVATLKDAAEKTQANADLDPSVKGQIVTALNLEVGHIESAAKTVTLTTPIEAPPEVAERIEYSVLPPIPEASKRPVTTVANPSAPTVANVAADEPVKLASTAGVPPPSLLKKPRLTIRCLLPGEAGAGASCIELEQNTLMVVRADDDLANAVSLRFLRRGDAKGLIELAQLRRGQQVRAKLPSQLCAGVASSKVQIEVLAGDGQVVDRLGPYRLRC